MDWIEAQLDDENIFPQKLGNLFVRRKVHHLKLHFDFKIFFLV
jgi:hypothetical protein